MEKGSRKVLLTMGVLVLLVTTFYFVSSSITKYTGFFVSDEVLNKPSDFELCLESQSITLYINSEKTSATLKNIWTLDFLENVNIVNCFRDNVPCMKAGVEIFPTWIINENKVERDISVFELADYSYCKLT